MIQRPRLSNALCAQIKHAIWCPKRVLHSKFNILFGENHRERLTEPSEVCFKIPTQKKNKSADGENAPFFIKLHIATYGWVIKLGATRSTTPKATQTIVCIRYWVRHVLHSLLGANKRIHRHRYYFTELIRVLEHLRLLFCRGFVCRLLEWEDACFTASDFPEWWWVYGRIVYYCPTCLSGARRWAPILTGRFLILYI